MTDPQNPNRLKIPAGVSSEGPAMDATEAYVKAVIAIPAYLKLLTDAIEELVEAVNVLAAYCEKEGVEKGYFPPEVDDGSSKAD